MPIEPRGPLPDGGSRRFQPLNGGGRPPSDRSPLTGCIGTSLKGGYVSPNQPKTPNHTVRVDDELWRAAMRKAHDRGETLTDVIVRALKRYLRD